MKELFEKMKNKATELYVKAKCSLQNTEGQGSIDTAITILISVVLGALILTALYTLFNGPILTNITSKITEMFEYDGSIT